MSTALQFQPILAAGIVSGRAGGAVAFLIANASWARLGHKLNRATGPRTSEEVDR